MSVKINKTRLVIRNDVASNWASKNPILLKGEMGFERDTRKFKLGDGVTNWNNLLYANITDLENYYTKEEIETIKSELIKLVEDEEARALIVEQGLDGRVNQVETQITEVENLINEVKEQVDNMVVEETDPTVPSWAKQPNKPEYTPEEIGEHGVVALDENGKVPSSYLPSYVDDVVEFIVKNNNYYIPAYAGTTVIKQEKVNTIYLNTIKYNEIDFYENIINIFLGTNFEESEYVICTLKSNKSIVIERVHSHVPSLWYNRIVLKNDLEDTREILVYLDIRNDSSLSPSILEKYFGNLPLELLVEDEIISINLNEEQLKLLSDYISFYPFTYKNVGESGKIYVDIKTSKTYRWSGTEFVEISSSLALGETSSTAYAGDKGKQNRERITKLEEETKWNIKNIDDLKNDKSTIIKNTQLPNINVYGRGKKVISEGASTPSIYFNLSLSNEYITAQIDNILKELNLSTSDVSVREMFSYPIISWNDDTVINCINEKGEIVDNLTFNTIFLGLTYVPAYDVHTKYSYIPCLYRTYANRNYTKMSDLSEFEILWCDENFANHYNSIKYSNLKPGFRFTDKTYLQFSAASGSDLTLDLSSNTNYKKSLVNYYLKDVISSSMFNLILNPDLNENFIYYDSTNKKYYNFNGTEYIEFNTGSFNIDETPTENSENLVTSGGVKAYTDTKSSETLSSAKSYTDIAKAAAKSYTDSEISKINVSGGGGSSSGSGGGVVEVDKLPVETIVKDVEGTALITESTIDENQINLIYFNYDATDDDIIPILQELETKNDGSFVGGHYVTLDEYSMLTIVRYNPGESVYYAIACFGDEKPALDNVNGSSIIWASKGFNAINSSVIDGWNPDFIFNNGWQTGWHPVTISENSIYYFGLLKNIISGTQLKLSVANSNLDKNTIYKLIEKEKSNISLYYNGNKIENFYQELWGELINFNVFEVEELPTENIISFWDSNTSSYNFYLLNNVFWAYNTFDSDPHWSTGSDLLFLLFDEFGLTFNDFKIVKEKAEMVEINVLYGIKDFSIKNTNYYNYNGEEYIEFATSKNPMGAKEVKELPEPEVFDSVSEGTAIVHTPGETLEKVYINLNASDDEIFKIIDDNKSLFASGSMGEYYNYLASWDKKLTGKIYTWGLTVQWDDAAVSGKTGKYYAITLYGWDSIYEYSNPAYVIWASPDAAAVNSNLKVGFQDWIIEAGGVIEVNTTLTEMGSPDFYKFNELLKDIVSSVPFEISYKPNPDINQNTIYRINEKEGWENCVLYYNGQVLADLLSSKSGRNFVVNVYSADELPTEDITEFAPSTSELNFYICNNELNAYGSGSWRSLDEIIDFLNGALGLSVHSFEIIEDINQMIDGNILYALLNTKVVGNILYPLFNTKIASSKYYNFNGKEYVEFLTNKSKIGVIEVEELPEAKIIDESGGNGTTIPTTGTLEKVYINLNASDDEIFKIINDNKSLFTSGSMGEYHNYLASWDWKNIGEAETNGLAVQWDDRGGTRYAITLNNGNGVGEYSNPAYVIWASPDAATNNSNLKVGFQDWIIEAGGVIEVNATLTDRGSSDHYKFNELLKDIVSSTPFEVSYKPNPDINKTVFYKKPIKLYDLYYSGQTLESTMASLNIPFKVNVQFVETLPTENILPFLDEASTAFNFYIKDSEIFGYQDEWLPFAGIQDFFSDAGINFSTFQVIESLDEMTDDTILYAFVNLNYKYYNYGGNKFLELQINSLTTHTIVLSGERIDEDGYSYLKTNEDVTNQINELCNFLDSIELKNIRIKITVPDLGDFLLPVGYVKGGGPIAKNFQIILNATIPPDTFSMLSLAQSSDGTNWEASYTIAAYLDFFEGATLTFYVYE